MRPWKFFIFILSIIAFAILPIITAWNYETHETIIENTYAWFNLQSQGFNLTLMKYGAIAPDKIFRDYKNHHYPNSYPKAIYWLNITKIAFLGKNLPLASYSFGVASHYISDSFVAPHYMKNEGYNLHMKFENSISNYDAKCKISNHSSNLAFIIPNINEELNLTLSKAAENKNDWAMWINNFDNSIPNREFKEAISTVYYTAAITFNLTCKYDFYNLYKRNKLKNNILKEFVEVIKEFI